MKNFFLTNKKIMSLPFTSKPTTASLQSKRPILSYKAIWYKKDYALNIYRRCYNYNILNNWIKSKIIR